MSSWQITELPNRSTCLGVFTGHQRAHGPRGHTEEDADGKQQEERESSHGTAVQKAHFGEVRSSQLFQGNLTSTHTILDAVNHHHIVSEVRVEGISYLTSSARAWMIHSKSRQRQGPCNDLDKSASARGGNQLHMIGTS